MRKNTVMLRLIQALVIVAMLAVAVPAFAADTAIVAEGFVMERGVDYMALRVPEREEWLVLQVPEALHAESSYKAQLGGKVSVRYQLDGQSNVLKELSAMDYEVLSGHIAEIHKDGILIQPYEGSPVFAHISDDVIAGGLLEMHMDMPVRVTYNGIMTRSMPGQITADAVVVPVMTGEIASLHDGGFLLKQDNGMGEVIIHYNQDTVIPADLALNVGDRLQVVTNGTMALSLPPQATALFLIPVVAE